MENKDAKDISHDFCIVTFCHMEYFNEYYLIGHIKGNLNSIIDKMNKEQIQKKEALKLLKYISDLEAQEIYAQERFNNTGRLDDGVLAYDLQTRVYEAKRIYKKLYGTNRSIRLHQEEVAGDRDPVPEVRQERGFFFVAEDWGRQARRR